jgi:hypothetical protein
MKTMVIDKIKNENPHLRSAIFELPLYISRVINEFGSAVATRDKCYFGNIPFEALALIVDFAYIDPNLIPIQGALMKLLKDVFTKHQKKITPETAEFLSVLQSDISFMPSLLDKFVFNDQGRVVSKLAAYHKFNPMDDIECECQETFHFCIKLSLCYSKLFIL